MDLAGMAAEGDMVLVGRLRVGTELHHQEVGMERLPLEDLAAGVL